MGLDTLEEAVDEYIDSRLAQWTQELLIAAIILRVEYIVPKLKEFYFQLIPQIIKYFLNYQLIPVFYPRVFYFIPLIINLFYDFSALILLLIPRCPILFLIHDSW